MQKTNTSASFYLLLMQEARQKVVIFAKGEMYGLVMGLLLSSSWMSSEKSRRLHSLRINKKGTQQ